MPWYGALVGCLTNLAGQQFFGKQYLNFAPVSVWGALLWGVLAHRLGFGPFIPSDPKTNIYRQLTVRILLHGFVVGIASTLLVVAILSKYTGSVPIPEKADAATQHPAVLILRIFYDFFERAGLAKYGLIDIGRSQMAAILNFPSHLLTTIPDKIFSASLAFYVAICIARRSGYAEWRISARKMQLHAVFSPILFLVCYTAAILIHFLFNRPSVNLASMAEVLVWILPALLALASIWRGVWSSTTGRVARKSIPPESPMSYRRLTKNMDLLHYDLFDLYVVAYAIGLFTVFAYYTNDDVILAIRQVFEKGIGVFTLLVLLKVAPVFLSHLIYDD